MTSPTPTASLTGRYRRWRDIAALTLIIAGVVGFVAVGFVESTWQGLTRTALAVIAVGVALGIER